MLWLPSPTRRGVGGEVPGVVGSFGSGQRHILQPHLPLRDRLPICAPRNGDVPELLYAPLKHRLGDDVYRSLTHRAQEVSSFLEGIGQKLFAPHVVVLA